MPVLPSRRSHRIASAATAAVRLFVVGAAAVAFAGCVPTSESAEAEDGADRVYQLRYVVTPDPPAGGTWVEMRVEQTSDLLREVDMRAPPHRISSPTGDGDVALANGRLLWTPPRRGGSLRWFARIDHRRDSGSFDAHIASDWAIFRAEDVMPQARTRTLKGARSETTLTFDLPPGWSSVTEYFGRDHTYRITNAERRFDRPAGWIILGEIGVRYDRIAGVRVNVAAPIGHGMRRNDILALLNWTLPEILRLNPDFPKRLTIVGAGDPMWRGGLSGPRSLFIHADRPLISENATSTLLHEVMHIAIDRTAADGMDWIIQGLAEYYSLKVLHRSGSITSKRFIAAMREQAKWGSTARVLCTANSSGEVTARAVTVMSALDEEIRSKSEGKSSLDNVLAELAEPDEPVTLTQLIAVARKFVDETPDALRASRLPGCND